MKPGFQVHPRIDGVHRETPEPVKGYPLESANEQACQDRIITRFETESNRCADLVKSCCRMNAMSTALISVDTGHNLILTGRDIISF